MCVCTFVRCLLRAEGAWRLKTDDFLPYADWPHCYWTGESTKFIVPCVAATALLLLFIIEAEPLPQ